jgi:hypothetical protein
MLLCICISFESEDMHTYACAYSSIEPLAWDLGLGTIVSVLHVCLSLCTCMPHDDDVCLTTGLTANIDTLL